MKLTDLVTGAPSSDAPPLKLLDVTGSVPDAAPEGAGDVSKFFPKTPEEEERYKSGQAFIRGSAAGAFKTYAGFSQTLLEGLAQVGAVTPEMRDRFTTRAAEKIKQLETGDPDYEPARNSGEFLGEVLSMGLPASGFAKVAGLIKGGATFVGRMLTSGAIGAGASATQFIDPESDETRADLAKSGGISGVAFGAAAEPLRAFGTKLLNARVIKNFVNTARDLAAQFDENSSTTATSFQDGFRRINGVRKQLYDTRDAFGDQITAGGVDTSQTSQDISALLKQTTPTDKATRGTLNRALADLGTPKGVPTGLSPAAQAQVARQLGTGTVNYSRITKVREALDTAIENEKDGAKAKILIQARQAVDKLRDGIENQSAQLRKMSDEANKYYKDVYQPAAHKDFGTLKNASVQDMHAANKEALDIAVGDDSKRAGDLYKVLTAPGRRSIQQGIAARAIDSATNADSGVVDPKKLANFFRDHGNVKTFFPKAEDQKVIDGLVNLTTEGSSAFKRLAQSGHYWAGTGLMVGGTWRALSGHPTEGMAEIATGLSTMVFMGKVNDLLATQRGQNFLRAASKLRPGSPASVRALNRVMSTSSGVAGGALDPAQDALSSFGG